MNKCHSSQFCKLFLTKFFFYSAAKIFLAKGMGRSIYKKASWAQIEVDDEKQLWLFDRKSLHSGATEKYFSIFDKYGGL